MSSPSPRREGVLARGRTLAKTMTRTVKEGKVKEELRLQAAKVQAQWRRLVTGSASTRVRDHLTQAQQQPRYVKLFDKIAFTFGVLNIATCQYFLLNVPEYFPAWYFVVVPLLMGTRLYHFRSLNWHYFMLDFCYFVLACTMLNMSLLRRSAAFFKVCFIFATGALPVAIPIWRNSLIFHDYDKIVSVYIHILPCCLYYTLRWHTDALGARCLDEACAPLTAADYVRAVALYALWQALYILKTEVWDRSELDRNPQILTSLRWLAKDTKNAAARAVLRRLQGVGLFRADEDYDSTSMKTKLVFVACQLAVTVLSFLPSVFAYNWRAAHLAWIGAVFTMAVFNGASFYIEVFSVRYRAHIDQLEQMRTIAKAASDVASEIANINAAPHATDPDDKDGSCARPSLRQIQSDLQRTEQQVLQEMAAHARSFYICTAPEAARPAEGAELEGEGEVEAEGTPSVCSEASSLAFVEEVDS